MTSHVHSLCSTHRLQVNVERSLKFGDEVGGHMVSEWKCSPLFPCRSKTQHSSRLPRRVYCRGRPARSACARSGHVDCVGVIDKIVTTANRAPCFEQGRCVLKRFAN